MKQNLVLIRGRDTSYDLSLLGTVLISSLCVKHTKVKWFAKVIQLKRDRAEIQIQAV